MCREIMAGVRQLREKRDMSINEIKLTVAIEDPIDRERRAYMDMEVLFFPLPYLYFLIGLSSISSMTSFIVHQEQSAYSFLWIASWRFRIPIDHTDIVWSDHNQNPWTNWFVIPCRLIQSLDYSSSSKGKVQCHTAHDLVLARCPYIWISRSLRNHLRMHMATAKGSTL